MTPANDNEPTSQLAEGLRAYRNRPEKPEPLQSNWATEPTKLVEPEIKSTLFTEQRLEITPSIEQIEREMVGPVERNGDGQIVAIGRLKFADGVQTEPALTIGPDGDVIQYDRRMPTGAMLGCSERLTTTAGGSTAPDKVTLSNSHLTKFLLNDNDAKPRAYIPGKRNRRRGKSYSHDEAKALLAEAIANTPNMPTPTVYPKGLPAGTAQSSDCFIGMKVAATGKSGSITWVDMFTAGREYEEWMGAELYADPAHMKVLDAAMTAKTYADISPGGGETGARRRGRKMLQAANDNYMAAIKMRG